MMFKCNICKKDVDIDGVAMMLAFCIRHRTNLINVALCESCYKMCADESMRILNDRCLLDIDFGDDDN